MSMQKNSSSDCKIGRLGGWELAVSLSSLLSSSLSLSQPTHANTHTDTHARGRTHAYTAGMRPATARVERGTMGTTPSPRWQSAALMKPLSARPRAAPSSPATPRLGTRPSARAPIPSPPRAPSPALTRNQRSRPELLDANRGHARACLFRAASATAPGPKASSKVHLLQCPACGFHYDGDRAGAHQMRGGGSAAVCRGNNPAPQEQDYVRQSTRLHVQSDRLLHLEQELERERERCSQLQRKCDRLKAGLKIAQQDTEKLSARLSRFVNMNTELQVNVCSKTFPPA